MARGDAVAEWQLVRDPDATIWIVKADGTMPPIEMTTTAGVMDSWARWMPFPNTVGDEPVYF